MSVACLAGRLDTDWGWDTRSGPEGGTLHGCAVRGWGPSKDYSCMPGISGQSHAHGDSSTELNH